jgi:hypothetical protein
VDIAFHSPWGDPMSATPRIRQLANQYLANPSDSLKDKEREKCILEKIGPRARERQFLDMDDFLTICRWKSIRPLHFSRENAPDYVQAVTGTALTTDNERLRIESLTLLRGVGWPVAAAILHTCHREPYPMLDLRALRTLTGKGDILQTCPTKDLPDLWRQYTAFCRQLAKNCGVCMRTLDRALYQYDKPRTKAG